MLILPAEEGDEERPGQSGRYLLRCPGLGSLRLSWSFGNSGITTLKFLVPSPFCCFCPPALYFGGRTW